jgi:hypothetical protein
MSESLGSDGVDPFVGVPVVGAAYFRVRWSGRTYGGVGIGFLIGIGRTFLEWAVPRWRARLPLYSYVAVTGSELIVLEIAQTPRAHVRRTLGRWALSEIRAEPIDSSWNIRLCLPDRDVELEGVSFDEATETIVRQLVGH